MSMSGFMDSINVLIIHPVSLIVLDFIDFYKVSLNVHKVLVSVQYFLLFITECHRVVMFFQYCFIECS